MTAHPEVFPRFKLPSPPRPPRRGLRQIGKKGRKDRRELQKTLPILVDRSGGACERGARGVCTGLGQHQHHVLPRGLGGTNDPSNLLWVCFACHRHIHDNPFGSRLVGWLK